MCQYKCLSGNSKQVQKLFLKLPRKLYFSRSNPQDEKLEKSILQENHPLSSDFTIKPFVVVREEDRQPLCRAIVTFYEMDDNSYVGFFESFNDDNAVKILFSKIEEYAKENGKKRLVGPLDCSFWINYRFKINSFEKTYTGEPINKEYYPKLWEKAGFKVSDYYYSNSIRVPLASDTSEKCKKRLKYVLDNGYVFVHPTAETYNKELEAIYELLIKLYSTFPGFKYITKAQFITLFTPLKLILDFNMVELAYKNNKLCGFMICLPNYYGLTNGKITLMKLYKILKIKKKPKEYVILYMGVDKDSLGLGGAIAEILKNNLYKYQCGGIRALVHSGKVTGHYYEQLNVDNVEYVLLAKDIKEP